MRATQRYGNVVISGLAPLDAPRGGPWASIEEQLASTLDRLGIEPGLLVGLSGIEARRGWDDVDTMPSDVAAQAGGAPPAPPAAESASRVLAVQPPGRPRRLPEPAAASLAPGRMGLPTEAVNFDVGNAC